MGNLQRQTTTVTLAEAKPKSISLMKLAVNLENKDKASVMKFAREQASLTVANAINGAQISTLKREHPEELSNAMFELVLNTCDALQIENKPSEMQCAEISLAIIQKYGLTLKFDEVCLVLRKAKWGEFGEMYNRLDIAVIFGWIEKYLRSDERVTYIEREALAYKKRIDSVEISAENSEQLQKIYNSIAKRKISKDGSVEEAKKIKKTTLEEYVTKLESIKGSLKIKELEEMLKEYKTIGFKHGVEIIEKEILTRSQK
jgi:hypothetical protein